MDLVADANAIFTSVSKVKTVDECFPALCLSTCTEILVRASTDRMPLTRPVLLHTHTTRLVL